MSCSSFGFAKVWISEGPFYFISLKLDYKAWAVTYSRQYFRFPCSIVYQILSMNLLIFINYYIGAWASSKSFCWPWAFTSPSQRSPQLAVWESEVMHAFTVCMSNILTCTAFSTQQSTTFTKKMIEDNNTMDETVQFLGVSIYIHLTLYFTYIYCFLYSSLWAGSIGSFLW